MSGYVFSNRMCQNWQDKKWMKFSDTCPYWFRHAEKMHQPEFIKDALLHFYSDGVRTVKRWRNSKDRLRGGNQYLHYKLYKLYWKLHRRLE